MADALEKLCLLLGRKCSLEPIVFLNHFLHDENSHCVIFLKVQMIYV